MKVARVILKLIASLLFAFGSLAIVVQEDPWCKKMIAQAMKDAFATSYCCAMRCEVTSFNLSNLSMVLENVEVKPLNNNDTSWSWACKKYSMHISWWQLLRNHVMEMTNDAHDISLFSKIVAGKLAIRDHIEALIESPLVLPVVLKSFSIRHGQLQIQDEDRNATIHTSYNSRTILVGNKYKTAISLTHTDLTGAQSTQYLSDLGGHLEVDVIPRPAGLDVQATAQLTFAVKPLGPEHEAFVLSGSWKDGSGYFDIHNNDYTIGGSIVTVGESLIAQSFATFPISYVEALLRPKQEVKTKGLFSYQAQADLFDLDNFAHLHWSIDQAFLGNWGCKKIVGEFEKKEGKVLGDATVKIDDENILKASLHFDPVTRVGRCACGGTLASSIIFGQRPQLDLQVQLDAQKIHGACQVRDEAISQQVLSADIAGSLQDFRCSGSYKKNTFAVFGAFLPAPLLKTAWCKDEHQKSLLDLSMDQNKVDAHIDVQLIKGLAHHFASLNVFGEGKVNVYGMKSDDNIDGHISFADGALRIPMIYNGVDGFDVDYHLCLKDRILKLSSLDLSLHKGSLSSDQLVVSWREDGSLEKMDVPCSLKDCFISHHKDFFAIVSGSGLLKKDEHGTQVQGELIIDRSHLKGNVFEEQLQSDVFMPSSFVSQIGSTDPVYVDVSLTTSEPLKVKTPFLQTSAHIDASLKGEISSLEGAGTIELLGGSLSFPYKPLYISSGKIMLMPQQLDDPVIEFSAKNTIKKYMVSVLASGTARRPKISFASVPQLSEEQIITLLCTGSEDAGLLSAVPSVIMHNIQQLIFGPADEASSFSKYFQKIFRPFENAALLEVKPVTGRTHQIRVHMAAIGHPILGDILYGHKSKAIGRQALHAYEIAFKFQDKDYQFSCEIPADFSRALKLLGPEISHEPRV